MLFAPRHMSGFMPALNARPAAFAAHSPLYRRLRERSCTALAPQPFHAASRGTLFVMLVILRRRHAIQPFSFFSHGELERLSLAVRRHAASDISPAHAALHTPDARGCRRCISALNYFDAFPLPLRSTYMVLAHPPPGAAEKKKQKCKQRQQTYTLTKVRQVGRSSFILLFARPHPSSP
jgi:hypothetical protein